MTDFAETHFAEISASKKSLVVQLLPRDVVTGGTQGIVRTKSFHD